MKFTQCIMPTLGKIQIFFEVAVDDLGINMAGEICYQPPQVACAEFSRHEAHTSFDDKSAEAFSWLVILSQPL